MSTNLSVRDKAVKLHHKIIVSANLAQQNLFEMCQSLKEMRDSKLYKELGYSNFEDYCEKEVGMKRSNAYNYISIIEKISPENVQTFGQIGKSKLMLLATISQPEQAEIAEKVDLENTTVKQLKSEIDKLKEEKRENQSKLSSSEFQRLDAENRLKGVREYNSLLEEKLKTERAKSKELTSRVEELESRPVEVAVVDNSDSERRLQETIKSLEQENIRRNEELEQQYREDEKAVRKMLEKDKQEALDKLKAEYEGIIENIRAQENDSQNDSLGEFKVWLNVINKAFNHIECSVCEYKESHPDKVRNLFFSDIYNLQFRFNHIYDLVEENNETL